MSSEQSYATMVSEQQPLHYLPWHSPWAYGAAFLGVAVGATLLAFVLPSKSLQLSVAFVGNSMFFVNDMPRFLQEIGGTTALKGDYNIQQQSCLHGSLNFKSLLYRGNGMAHKWNTKHAYVKQGIYDFGACTVPQLLVGSDDNLVSGNANGYYKDDGRNPCFNNNVYLEYTRTLFGGSSTKPHYDFVLLNDRSTWPAIEEKRYNSIQILQNYYVPMLKESGGAIPVLFATHGYDSTVVDVSDFGGISNFTSDIFEGYRQYADMLAANLEVPPRIAPVGLAFLVVYEENYDMWQKLFFVDGYHPSPHGTYLMGCVLYATLYGYMPGNKALPSTPKSLWRRARKMQIGGNYHMPYPTLDEALYLYNVAEKVMMHGKRPTTWSRYYDETTESDYIGNWQ
jgi:hypothetical protein